MTSIRRVAADSGAARSDLGDRTGMRDVRNQSQRCMREVMPSGQPDDPAGRSWGVRYIGLGSLNMRSA